MNFVDFPLYASLKKHGENKENLTDLQKTELLKLINSIDDEKGEILYAIIRAHYLDNSTSTTSTSTSTSSTTSKKKKETSEDILHYDGKMSGKKIKYDINNLPSSLQHILYSFVKINNKQD